MFFIVVFNMPLNKAFVIKIDAQIKVFKET